MNTVRHCPVIKAKEAYFAAREFSRSTVKGPRELPNNRRRIDNALANTRADGKVLLGAASDDG